MSLFGQALANGILLGGVLALSAVGFSLIFGVMDILNLTHGAVVILAAFTSYFAYQLLAIDPFLSVLPIMGIMFVAGYAYQRTVVTRILDEEILVTLLVTFGFALMIRNLLEIFITATPRSITPSYATESIQTGVFGALPVVRLGALAVAIVLFVALTWFINSTSYGRKIRATAENPDIAQLCGINTEHIYGITFGLGSALAGASGVLIGLTTSFQPIDEATWTLYAFVVVVLGGFGKPAGALLGGLLLGLAWSYTTIYISSSIAGLVAFSLLVVMLLIKPQGILGGWAN
jgi:branched-chain amino acid transport system permease protein